MSNFTPGPWGIYGHNNDLEIRPVAVREDVSLIAVLPLDSYADLEDWNEFGSMTMDANARLIANAPDMVDVLREVAMLGLPNFDDKLVFNKQISLGLRAAALLRRIEGEDS